MRQISDILLRPALHLLRANLQNIGLIYDLTKRDLKLRYLGSYLGRYWNIVHPLAMISIYTVVFAVVLEAKIPGMANSSTFSFSVFLCAGLLPWNAFTETVLRGTNSYLEHGHLIKKVAFPIEILQSISTASAGLTFWISWLLYFGFLILSDFGIGWPMILLPVIFFLQMMFALGLAYIFSVLNVFFRDIQQLVNIIFQLWFWVTPIVYLKENAPEELQFIFKFNPFFYFVRAYQDITVFKQWPSQGSWIAMGVIASVTFCLGASFVSFTKREIPDEV